jgi:hypothetical protein
MGQVTLYMDDETQTRLKTAARAEGVSVSRWLTRLARRELDERWPDAVVASIGAWPDFPLADAIRDDAGDDVERAW